LWRREVATFELACLELSRQSFNAIETGRFNPSLPLAFKLARIFATTIDAIFTEASAPGAQDMASPASAR